MKTIIKIPVFLSILFVSQNLLAVTHYVSLSGGNVSPYINWANAATTIQAAVDVASPGETVLVNNGVYNTGEIVTPGHSCSNRVIITKDITVESVSGPYNTIILGNGPNGSNAVRGVYMSAGILSGFTVSNGHTLTVWDTDDWYYDISGGGVNMYGGSGIITNCIISGNSANLTGGGTSAGTIYNCTICGNRVELGGGTYGSIVNNSTISGNLAIYGGGAYSGTVNKCTISGNSADYGGGAYAATVNNSTISGNSANDHGGGTYNSIVNMCIISGNSAGGGGGAYYGTINNSIINGNMAGNAGGASICTINNCTISGNTAKNGCGGGTIWGTINNCIIWNNSAGASNNFYGSRIKYSCSLPLPPGEGNIANNPEFISSSDFHLQDISPCIDTGTNAFAPMPYDLDGNPRIIDNIVDMGAYEYIPEPFQFINCYLLFIIYYLKRKF